jgi:hypothetical protein
VHKEEIRLPNFRNLLTHVHPVELRSIQGVNISINISVIMMSCDRRPEIKMSTVMFKAVNTPECYHDKKENTKTEVNVPVNFTILM